MNSIFSSTRVDFCKMLKDLAELDFDAIEAYKLAISKLKNQDHKTQLQKFLKDHERHTSEINGVLSSHGQQTIKGPGGKQWVVKGEVLLGKTLNDDKGILKAMSYIEDDTNKAYEEIIQYKIWDDATNILRQGLSDEKEHKNWLEATLKSLH